MWHLCYEKHDKWNKDDNYEIICDYTMCLLSVVIITNKMLPAGDFVLDAGHHMLYYIPTAATASTLL